MNDLESSVEERLRARESNAPSPSPGLAAAIGAAVERRSRRRRVRTTAGVALVAAVTITVVVVPTMFSGNSQPSRPHPATSTSKGPTGHVTPPPSTAAHTTHTTLPEGLARLFPGVAAVVIDRRLADGSDFRAMSVSHDGVVAGLNQSMDEQFSDKFNMAVLLDLNERSFSSYAEANLELAEPGRSPAADRSALLWSIGPPDRCLGLANDRNARRAAGARLDHGHLVWNRSAPPEGYGSSSTVMVANGCDPGKRLAAQGELVAVGWPWIYLRGTSDNYFRVNADTSRRESIPRPADVPVHASANANTFGVAANGNVVAWQVDGHLAVCELPASACAGLSVPVVKGVNGASVWLSVGDRFVAYGTSGIDGDPIKGKGVVYDTTTHEFITLPGEALTAGPWLLWLERDGYHVLDTRAGG